MSAAVRIIFEDDNLLILDKPPGIHSVSNPNSIAPSVASLLAHEKPEQVGASHESGLLNRLDLWTSGLMMAARHRGAWLKLRQLTGAGGIEKQYLAVVEGRLDKALEVNAAIGSAGRRCKKVKVFSGRIPNGVRALPATTTFEVLRYDCKRDFSVVKARITQGRRHQIRAHASFIKHPLLGDLLYGSKRNLQELLDKPEPPFLLHACLISFVSPFDGKRMQFEAPYPGAKILSG